MSEAEKIRVDGVAQVTTVPIVEESATIEKKIVAQNKVEFIKTVREVIEKIDVPLVHEELNVERVEINQVVAAPPPPIRYEGNKMIISILHETLVVEKRLVLVEELHVTKRQVETIASEEVLLRKEQVNIERTPLDSPPETVQTTPEISSDRNQQ